MAGNEARRRARRHQTRRLGANRFRATSAGYTLCGDVSEEVCFFLYGEGANGKTTFMQVVHGVLGEYVGTLSSGVVTRSHGNETEVRLAKAGAVGKRLIWSNETKEGDVFDDDVLKVFSSRDPIPDARWHHQRPFSFTPTHTLWMRGNHKPGVRDASHSFWRRMILIDFTVKFQGAAIKHNLDKRILATEAPGVLRWMVEGCLKWQRDGRLTIPARIEAKRASYRKETDILGQWISERCELDPMAVTRQAVLFENYRHWMMQENHRGAGSGTTFGRKLEGRGFPRGENDKGRIVQGLRLKAAGLSW